MVVRLRRHRGPADATRARVALDSRGGIMSQRAAILVLATAVCATSAPTTIHAQAENAEALDARVRAFLDRARGDWHDMNVPYAEGQALHDLIVKRGLKRGLEIGTSTGHSGIWIAWAMSRTGGKLTTIEIDPDRHRTALKNFEAAGVLPYVDARLGNAHEVVKELPGPFDFVFSDADKDWYTQYFKDLDDKVTVGGCFTAHNVLDGYGGVEEFLDYVRSRPNYLTIIEHTSPSGLSVSCKTR
jgi:predicted O-methyltransferase YrrM